MFIYSHTQSSQSLYGKKNFSINEKTFEIRDNAKTSPLTNTHHQKANIMTPNISITIGFCIDSAQSEAEHEINKNINDIMIIRFPINKIQYINKVC